LFGCCAGFSGVIESMRERLNGANVAIIGLARTGLAAAEVLARLGAHVIVYDRKPAAALASEIAEAERIGVEARVGRDTVDYKGLDLLVTSPGVNRNAPVLTQAVAEGVEVISEIELAYRISRAPILAVTGTNGKTTTTVLLGRVMEADGRNTFIAGNISADELKMPLVKAAYEADSSAVIAAEISTFQLEWIKYFRPRVAALLNISADHGDRHSSFSEYAALKARIFENQESEDFAVVNRDNRWSLAAAKDVRSSVLQFSVRRKVENGAYLDGGDVIFCIGGSRTKVLSASDILLPGSHNLENVLAAVCMSLAFGAEVESVRKAVSSFDGVPHRMEKVAAVAGVQYINNSMCTNPKAFERSLEAVGGSAVVIAGGKFKGGRMDPIVRSVKKYAKALILIGASADLFESRVRAAGYNSIHRADSLEEAVNIAHNIASSGDTVILAPACASFDMFQDFEERGRVFRESVKKLPPSAEQD